MKIFHILDCTLRDGAYIVDGNFGDNAIKGIIANLEKSNIDMIEVGWLKDKPHESGSTYYRRAEDIVPYLPAEKTKSYIAMIDYGRYDLKYLSDYDGTSIDTVREVFPKEKFTEAIEFSKKIKEKGYNLCLQAANTYSYSDLELIQLAEKTNEVMPESLSIVDTFGVMYASDLQHIFMILDKNLDKNIKIGFHSHNNLQLSFALSMEFAKLAFETGRSVIIDSSLCGMGRGAGNTCTELITNYVNNKFNKNYDLNCIMDTIDLYMKNFISNYKWGYSIPYCIAGQLGSHVNNIAYLQNTHKTNYKDMKIILETLPRNERKLYNYDKLEEVYVNYQNKKIDDKESFNSLKSLLADKNILLIAPGKSVKTEQNKIFEFISSKKPLIIGVNHIPEIIDTNFLFFSNPVRFDYAKTMNGSKFFNTPKIVVSNVKTLSEKNEYLVNYNSLTKLGWKYFDNSTVMLIRLLDKIGIKNINLAGFDGYDETGKESYNDLILQSTLSENDCKNLNRDISEMLNDFFITHPDITLNFVTSSRFEQINNKALLKI